MYPIPGKSKCAPVTRSLSLVTSFSKASRVDTACAGTLSASTPAAGRDADREAVVRAYARSAYFKEDVIRAFYDGIKHKPQMTFGNVKADVLADKDPSFQRENFCTVIRRSAWCG
jgi:hypothetical protein